MEKGYHKGQELCMSELGLALEELADQPPGLFAQKRVRLPLAIAPEEEVSGALMCRL